MSGEQRIDEKRLAEIEARASAATPGPWSQLLTDVMCHGTPEGDWVVACDVVGDGDAAFIGAARTDVPDLIADLRAARAENERLNGEAEKRAAEGRAAGIEAMRGPMHDQRRLGAEEEREACARLADSEEPTGALARLIRARGGAS